MRKLMLLCGALVVLSGCSSISGMVSSIGKSKLETALDSCGDQYSGYIDIQDNGKTLTIDGEGNDSKGSPIKETACVLFAIPVPQYVISRMDKTRALDGMQRETFDNYDISWSYHPDNGLDIVIHEQ